MKTRIDEKSLERAKEQILRYLRGQEMWTQELLNASEEGPRTTKAALQELVDDSLIEKPVNPWGRPYRLTEKGRDACQS